MQGHGGTPELVLLLQWPLCLWSQILETLIWIPGVYVNFGFGAQILGMLFLCVFFTAPLLSATH